MGRTEGVGPRPSSSGDAAPPVFSGSRVHRLLRQPPTPCPPSSPAAATTGTSTSVGEKMVEIETLANQLEVDILKQQRVEVFAEKKLLEGRVHGVMMNLSKLQVEGIKEYNRLSEQLDQLKAEGEKDKLSLLKKIEVLNGRLEKGRAKRTAAAALFSQSMDTGMKKMQQWSESKISGLQIMLEESDGALSNVKTRLKETEDLYVTRKVDCEERLPSKVTYLEGKLAEISQRLKDSEDEKKALQGRVCFAPVQPPDYVVVLETDRKSSVILEAARLQVPVVALVDSSLQLEYYEKTAYPLPANDSMEFVYLFCNIITKTFLA
ncbi:unnamed protein product [Linum tenue]|uniref:Uncharacterized protein n=1 Tax=Linum tenue TaxID=586396 RepID=A0AAV0H467_9ROSI|nr:unnamed protein product [Linum tenue]